MSKEFRIAKPEDVFQISGLYYEIYQGHYPDPLMRDFNLIQSFLSSSSNFWFIAEVDHELVASVLFSYDEENRIAKAFGAVTKNQYRGKKMMEDLIAWAIHHVDEQTQGLEIIYSTTRTVNEAAQGLTENLGFNKLGIFPNAHRTEDYETHGLAAIIRPAALERRFTDFKMHHQLKHFYDLVKNEVGLAEIDSIVPGLPSRTFISCGPLEVINAEKFINFRYELLKKEKKLDFEFFPFHKPNLMIITPDQTVELFFYLSSADGHCAYLGGHLPQDISYTDLFLNSNRLLGKYGARYLEMLVRADKPKILESVIAAKFIPCAYFPAFQKIGNLRYDFFVFSKSFEIFDFQNVRLRGINQSYLEEYFKAWKRVSLMPKMLE